MSDSLKAKLIKLLAVANHPNTNPDEAANAAAAAARLAAQHNLDLDALSRVASGEDAIQTHLSDWHFGEEYSLGLYQVASWVGRLFSSVAIVNVDPRESVQRMIFVGKRRNTELAHSWLKYLWNSCLRANTEHARSMNYGDASLRQKARESFRFAFCLAVMKRLREKFEAMKSETMTSSSGRELVVTNYLDQAHGEIEAWISQKSKLNVQEAERRRRIPNASDEAMAAGWGAGSTVGLEDQIKS